MAINLSLGWHKMICMQSIPATGHAIFHADIMPARPNHSFQLSGPYNDIQFDVINTIGKRKELCVPHWPRPMAN